MMPSIRFLYHRCIVYYVTYYILYGISLTVLIFWQLTVMNACIPTTKPWRAAKMHTVFLVILFLGFILCAIMFGVSITLWVDYTTPCTRLLVRGKGGWPGEEWTERRTGTHSEMYPNEWEKHSNALKSMLESCLNQAGHSGNCRWRHLVLVLLFDGSFSNTWKRTDQKYSRHSLLCHCNKLMSNVFSFSLG